MITHTITAATEAGDATLGLLVVGAALAAYSLTQGIKAMLIGWALAVAIVAWPMSTVAADFSGKQITGALFLTALLGTATTHAIGGRIK